MRLYEAARLTFDRCLVVLGAKALEIWGSLGFLQTVPWSGEQRLRRDVCSITKVCKWLHIGVGKTFIEVAYA